MKLLQLSQALSRRPVSSTSFGTRSRPATNQVEGVQLLRDLRFVGVLGEPVDPAHQVDDALGFRTLAGDSVRVMELAQPGDVFVRRGRRR